MPRWLWITLLIAVAAYGWHRTAQSRARGAHEVVAVNRSGRPLEQVRIEVGGRRLDVAALDRGESARFALLCERDDTFELKWRSRGGDLDRHWSGGVFHHGPVRMRYRFEFVAGDGVVWRSERIVAKKERRVKG